jgi:putative ABC transport system substrate-binding protein
VEGNKLIAELESEINKWQKSLGSKASVTHTSPLWQSINVHRDLIIALASRQRIPVVYSFRTDAARGGLMSYGPNTADLFQRAAEYRILKGEKPADLPVQAPTKFDLVVNIKTAKALGLTVPMSLLGRVDEVIE